MKIMKKIGIFALVVILLFSVMSISVFAAGDGAENGAEADSGKLDMGLNPESFGDRLGYAVQGTVTGILMVFAVLTLLTLILYASKLVFYDIPNKKSEKAIAARNEKKPETVIEDTKNEDETSYETQTDDGELVAVITAAVAAMIESSEYKNEFAGGFRVVSFKRNEKTAWNRK